jgi:pyruvate,water dikinase
VQVASERPSVRDWLSATDAPTLDGLRALPDGNVLAAEIGAFLAVHGHLGSGFDDLTLPSWRDEPALLLAEIAKRLRQPAAGGIAKARGQHLREEAEALATAVRARLAADPVQLSKFEATLAFARDIGPITEVHNYWIDRMAHATLRRFVRRVGERLVKLGVIGLTDDAFYLRRDEVPQLLRSSSPRGSLVTERRSQHASQRASAPPRYLGKAPESGPSGRFDGERLASGSPDLLQGTGASAGRVRGTARVTISSADFARVQPGDIIVCPSSNPSWVPLFAIAGGLITNTGGVLSHAAVVAREFGLPAVVGTGDATERIADGRTVELDGASGEVRLL